MTSNKKKIIVFTIVSFVCFVLLIFYLYKPNPLASVENYKIYYDKLNAEIIKDLANYDMAILEPLEVLDEDVEYIKAQSKIKLFGYLSVIDIEHYDDVKKNAIHEEDYLIIDQEKVYIKKHECYLADISSPHYHDVLLDLIETKIISKGFDGVFLDTVGRIEDYDEKTNKDLMNGYIIFMKKLKAKYPDLLIIQNRGFNSFLDGTAGYIDGLLYEDFDADIIKNSEYYTELIANIKKKAERENVIVLALTFNSDQKTKEYIKTLGWKYLYHREDSVYNTWYFEDLK